MSDFTPAYAAINLDPYKRVHYAPGLVLGVEDFVQEELYLLFKGRLHNRALHGYGTVCGLGVETRVGDGGEPEVLVRAGIALDPLGREIRVPQDQCAGINRWLEANAATLGSPPPDPLPLYLVLCYRECTTDDVPVPGGPCRSQEDSRVPSRIADDFELALRTEAPPQIEEDAVRAFGDLLRSIEISDAPDAPGELLEHDDLNELVRALGGGSPGVPPALGSPALYRLHPDTAADLLQAAFRVWVTEVRPTLLPEGRNCTNGPPPETCVLLARLELSLDADASQPQLVDVVGDDLEDVVVVDEESRPYLLHTRLLQEWLRNQSGATLGEAGGDLRGSYPNPTVVGLQDTPVADDLDPRNDQVLTWAEGEGTEGAAWQAQDLPMTSHGDLEDLGADDHDLYLPRNGDRPMTGSLDMNGHFIDMAGEVEGDAQIINLSPGTAAGHAVEHDQALKDGDLLPNTSDLAGTYPAPTIARLQGEPLNANPTIDGQVLTWNGTAWVARSPAAVGEPEMPEMEQGLVRILALSWAHGGSTNGIVGYRISGPFYTSLLAFVVQFAESDQHLRVQVGPGSLDRHTFQVFVRAPYLILQEERMAPAPGLYQWIGLESAAIRPVTGRVGPTQTRVTEISAEGEGDLVNAQAAAFLPDPRALYLLQSLQSRGIPIELRIQIHGDQVLDEEGHAIDANHLRAETPTGDRAGGTDLGLGLQGGMFESWLTLTEVPDPQNIPDTPDTLIPVENMRELFSYNPG